MTLPWLDTLGFQAPKRPVSRVFLHCSDSDRPEHDSPKTVQRWHLDRGFSGIGYHFLVTKDGVLHPGRPLEQVPAAQQGHNTGTIAVCLTGRHQFTAAQFRTLKQLCAEIQNQLPLVTFHGHKEVDDQGKTCPNFPYREVLGLTAKGELT